MTFVATAPVSFALARYVLKSPPGTPEFNAELGKMQDQVPAFPTWQAIEIIERNIGRPLNEVFEKRHGVCQDFAHVMIAGLRGLGLPAAYVSGYLRTIPPPGKPRLQGADATHAWVSAWCGAELGWIGFDPTNDLLIENDHIILAVGRDFSDVSPVDGIIVGSRNQKLGVAVDVIPVA